MPSSRPGALSLLVTAIVGATSLAVVAFVATPSRLESETTGFVLVAVIGYLVGVIVARGFVNDTLGHLLAMIASIGVPFVVFQQSSISTAVRSGSFSTLLTENRDRFEGAVTAFQSGSAIRR